MSEINSFSKAFKTVKTFGFSMFAFAIIVVILSVLANIYIYKLSQNRVVIVAPDKTMVGYTEYDRDISVHEMQLAVKNFIGYMFSFDQSSFKANVEKAMNLCLETDGRTIYNQFKNNNLQEALEKTDAKVYVQIDSVTINNSTTPATGKMYFKQTFETATSSNTTALGANFSIFKYSRTDANPLGLKLGNIVFFEYVPVQAQQQYEPTVDSTILENKQKTYIKK